jgi:hypothetical protein
LAFPAFISAGGNWATASCSSKVETAKSLESLAGDPSLQMCWIARWALSCSARRGPVPGIHTPVLAEDRPQSRGHHRRIRGCRSQGTIQDPDREGAPTGWASDPAIIERCSDIQHRK